jgi:plasmid stabilization system protein ParE
VKIKFSDLATFKLELLSDFLIKKWSEQSNLKFLEKLDSKLKTIQSNPNSYPQSEIQPGLRKCVVKKQTTVLYEVQNDIIYVLNIIDTRQDRKKIEKEIKNHIAQHSL